VPAVTRRRLTHSLPLPYLSFKSLLLLPRSIKPARKWTEAATLCFSPPAQRHDTRRISLPCTSPSPHVVPNNMAYHASSSNPYGYQPASPPWSQGGSPPPPRHYDGPPRAPVMPYAPLPSVHDYAPYAPVSPHHGLITPPPTPSVEVHPALCARPVVVRYDFRLDPVSVRMSSSAQSSSFPGGDRISNARLSTLYIRCAGRAEPLVIRGHGARSITCADLFIQLHHHFTRPISPEELEYVQGPQRQAMKSAFRSRTAISHERQSGMRMIDYLEGKTVFKRFTPDPTNGTTWILETTSAH